MTAMTTSTDLVLVTGASGYVAGHCILELVRAGYRVRGTVRSKTREAEVRGWLDRAHGSPLGDALELVEADLGADAGWAEAARGATYVLHVASPLPMTMPKDPEELIGPARDGTLRVLRAAHAAGVSRVVQTSSTTAITYGVDDPNDRVFTEADWTDPRHPDNVPYTRSKTIAERAAWDELAKLGPREGAKLEWVVINPALVLGPVLASDASTSVEVVDLLLKGAFPGLPRLGYPIVDVRDLAVLHVRAMTEPAAAGERFLASGDFLWMEEIATILRERLGETARKVPRRRLPSFAVRMAAWFDPVIRGQTFELDKRRRASSAKAERVFGWRTRPVAETIVDTAESLLRVRSASA